MKILVVDDNLAIQEMLSDMLSSNERKVETAGTVVDAVVKYGDLKPDVVLLNTKASGESTSKLHAIICTDAVRPKIFMIANTKDDVNEDMISDKWLCKPFKSSDITDLIDKLSVEGEKRSFFKGILGRLEVPHIRKKEAAVSSMDLKFGISYLFMEEDRKKIRDACRFFIENGEDILFITSGTPKSVKEMMRNDAIRICAFSSKEGPDYVDVTRIGSLMAVISSFIESAKRPVVIIDNLHMMIDANDMNSVMAVIDHTVNNVCKKTITPMASLTPKDVTDKDKRLLMQEMKEYTK